MRRIENRHALPIGRSDRPRCAAEAQGTRVYNPAVADPNQPAMSETLGTPRDRASEDSAVLESAAAPAPAEPMSFAERCLAWAGDDAPPAVRASQLRSLQLAMVATVVFEFTQFAAFRRVHAVVDVEGVFDRAALPWTLVALPIALGLTLLGLVIARHDRARRIAGAGAATVMAMIALTIFPNTPNHYPLIVLVLGMLAFYDPAKDEETAMALAGIRWLFAIALFLSGLQKILYGAYFGGEFFAFRIANDPLFASPFSWLMPSEEFARLRALGGMTEGAGPFRSSWWGLAAAANITWIAELVLPVLLLVRRTRPWAIAAVILFFIGIEVAPREIFFGAVAIQLVLVFGRRDWNGRLMPLWILVLVALTALRYLAPGVNFS